MIEIKLWLFILGGLGLLSLGGIVGMFIMVRKNRLIPHGGRLTRPYPWPDPPERIPFFQKEEE